MIARMVVFLPVWLALAGAQAQILSPAAKDLGRILPPPPADSSPAGLADLETVLQDQDSRTPAQIELAKRVDGQSAFSFGRPVLGDWFKSKSLPRTTAIFDRVNRETSRIIDASKQQWNRQRPYQRSAQVAIVVGLPRNASYPSGHVAIAAVWAALLSAAFPEDAPAFEKQVHQVMWARVIAGVHFPSDTAAGGLLGDAIGRDLLKNPETQRAIETIREETAALRPEKGS